MIPSALFIWYAIRSKSNPRALEVALGSLVLGVAVGTIATFMPRIIERKLAVDVVLMIAVCVFMATLCIAVLIRYSNVPNKIKEDLRVTYLFCRDTAFAEPAFGESELAKKNRERTPDSFVPL